MREKRRNYKHLMHNEVYYVQSILKISLSNFCTFIKKEAEEEKLLNRFRAKLFPRKLD